jgi:Cysteine rich repeat
MMGDITLRLGVLLVAATIAAPALAQTPAEDVTAAMQGQLAAEVLEGCKAELRQHCADVTPGEGRLLACLFAYDDKLSGQCEFALYNAAVRLERALNTITYVMSECDVEIESQCTDVAVGQGRIAQCLIDHRGDLSEACSRALSDAGVQ